MDDAQNEALTALTNQMFAGEIAEGSIVVTDPEPVAPAPVQVAPAPAPVAPAEAVPAPAAPVAAAQPGPVEAPEEVPTFKPKLNDDLQALLDEPDFEEEARVEVADEIDSEQYSYEDPEAQARLRALEKRNEFLETQLVAKSRKGWIEEAKRAYPDLARLLPGEIESIDAASRRAFIRSADKLNTRYQTVLAPTLAKLEAERAAIAAGAVATARQEVADAWGRPAADTLPSDAAATADALARARATGSLEESIKVLMRDNPVL